MCTTQLLSLQIETVLSHDCSRVNRKALKAEIFTILAFLRDIEESWLNAKWAARVFGWVVERTGISLGEVGAQHYQAGSSVGGLLGNPGDVIARTVANSDRPEGSAHQRGSQGDRLDRGQVQEDLVDHSRILDHFEFLPSTWPQDMIDQGIFEGQDQMMMFDVFGAPFQ